MNYEQFKNAAYRHLISCKYMLKEANDATAKKDAKDRLCLEIYYLSGYILETLLSYAVCSSMNISGDIYRSKPFTDDKNKFKVHDLKQKYNYALQKGCNGLRNICFFQKKHPDSKIQNLFSEWKVNYRYENRANLTPEILSTYINAIEDVYKIIIKKYTR